MASDRQFAESELSVSAARKPDSDVALRGWDIGIAVILAGVLFAAISLNLAPGRQTIGWALAYGLFTIAPPLVLALLEHLTRPAGPRKSAEKWWLHIQIMLANFAASIPIGLLATYLATLLVKSIGLDLGLIDLRIGNGKEILSLIAGLIISGLSGDFFFYWYHRSLHRSTILWQHHKMHHMDAEFDVLTGSRQNWLESFFSVFFILVPMAVLFKFNATDALNAGLLQGAVIGFWTLFVYQNHSNLRIQFGKGTVLFTSSQSHRIHHSYLPQHRDKNFVAFFPIWDILFGTYYHPARDEFPLTGVEGEEKEIQSVWEVQIFALREWTKMWRTHRRSTGLPKLERNGNAD